MAGVHNSKFQAGLASWLWLMIWTWTVNIITLGIAYPWTMCARYGWKINNLFISGQQVKFDGEGQQLFGNWLKWWALTIITFGIYGFWVPIKLIQWQAIHTYIPALDEQVIAVIPAVEEQTIAVSPAT